MRRVAALALPALVVLAAEPLYVLVDTAVVGHLGRTQLAGLAIGGSVMSLAVWLGTVLAYGTTGRAARRFGAGQRADAVEEGVQASWLALAGGFTILLVLEAAAGPLSRALAGGPGDVAANAEHWLRIAALGAPGLMLGTAGNGWMRGVQDTRRPLYYVLAANALSAALCPLLVYPAGLGLIGSAVANVTAQTVVGLLFVRALVSERVALRPRPAVILNQLTLGRDLLLRGAAFQACFLSASAVAARFGVAALAAHQIAIQLFFFTALALDALAIAAQSLVGAALGGERVAEARFLARRITVAGLVAGGLFAGLVALALLAVRPWFGADAQVYAEARHAWWFFVAMMPAAGVVFALDGVFLGAGDVGYLRNLTLVSALGGFLPGIWLAYLVDAGLRGVWMALTLFIALRLIGLLHRLAGDRWAVAGAVR
ncbi:MATE family efflux transporter [Dactylosporangium matsuzakiense]|uniref:DNA-damage-inducible protein F n=1 Tax=Dactylosporangium matsuzakiense TaxID=53360 RepID=A0A9W6KXN6_9ACTN|nr:MATE family efflux transporter [Dactylosporangium matsuzakiense]UWZ49432.1 MATE family efflux transporter [Dactylosporangium matsuzakiense]GLL08599.1 putative DNA-damage-inducible protein F [Dactylosporangium matsuzakiense]